MYEALCELSLNFCTIGLSEACDNLKILCTTLTMERDRLQNNLVMDNSCVKGVKTIETIGRNQ